MFSSKIDPQMKEEFVNNLIQSQSNILAHMTQVVRGLHTHILIARIAGLCHSFYKRKEEARNNEKFLFELKDFIEFMSIMQFYLIDVGQFTKEYSQLINEIFASISIENPSLEVAKKKLLELNKVYNAKPFQLNGKNVSQLYFDKRTISLIFHKIIEFTSKTGQKQTYNLSSFLSLAHDLENEYMNAEIAGCDERRKYIAEKKQAAQMLVLKYLTLDYAKTPADVLNKMLENDRETCNNTPSVSMLDSEAEFLTSYRDDVCDYLNALPQVKVNKELLANFSANITVFTNRVYSHNNLRKHMGCSQKLSNQFYQFLQANGTENFENRLNIINAFLVRVNTGLVSIEQANDLFLSENPIASYATSLRNSLLAQQQNASAKANKTKAESPAFVPAINSSITVKTPIENRPVVDVANRATNNQQTKTSNGPDIFTVAKVGLIVTSLASFAVIITIAALHIIPVFAAVALALAVSAVLVPLALAYNAAMSFTINTAKTPPSSTASANQAMQNQSGLTASYNRDAHKAPATINAHVETVEQSASNRELAPAIRMTM